MRIFILISIVVLIVLLLITLFYNNDFLWVFLLMGCICIAVATCERKNKAFVIGGEEKDYMKENLLTPEHNLKEVTEQLILLEDHLAHPHRRCRDCITKHYLTIEACLREAVTLDKENKHFDEIQDLLNSIKPAMIKLLEKFENGGVPTNDEYLATTHVLRENRKKIMIKYALCD